jgi:transcriptional regulator with XRE-family HTH domain
MGIGQRIREFRKMRNMSQAELAYKAKTEPSSISRWETEKGKPSASSLKNLAVALGVSIGRIVEDEEYDELPQNDDFAMHDMHSSESITTSKIVIEHEEGKNKTRIIIPYSKDMFDKAKEILTWFSSDKKGKNQKNSKIKME